jgi:hypothetical protein
MKILVNRQWYTPRSTCGVMSIDGVRQCFTLEPPYDKTQTIKPRAIPAGTYPAELILSPEFHFKVLLLQNVPDFSGVEIHCGNWPRNTKGCTLIGETHQPDYVGSSDAEYAVYLAKIETATEWEVTYADDFDWTESVDATP